MAERNDLYLVEGFAIEQLQEMLGGVFNLELRDKADEELQVLDDHDWQIWKSGALLVRRKDTELSLYRDDDSLLAQASGSAAGRFWWDLPDGDLATHIKKLVPLRAFYPRFYGRLATWQFAVLNADDKTVVRLRVFRLGDDEKNNSQSLMSILPLRGYNQEYQQVQKALAPLMLARSRELNLRQLMIHAGMQVEYPPGKPVFDLDPEEPAEAAVTRMAVSLMQLARHQEAGIIADIDTEFVHQYRVNIRKARSLVSLFKKTLTAERFSRLKEELKAIGGRTNELRDLDVFLLNQDYYRDLLPEALHPGLEQIFSRIRRRRTNAFRRVRNALDSDAYIEQISRLLLTMKQAPDFATKQARTDISSLVAKKILGQYRTIVREGERIDDSTPDAEVHELRIECKKLRYLLELFSELFPGSQLKKSVKRLKRLQDNLGLFNDFAVQQEFLDHFASRYQVSAEELGSINGLTAVLFHQQRAERQKVVQNVGDFIAPKVQESFQQLFHKGVKESSKL